MLILWGPLWWMGGILYMLFFFSVFHLIVIHTEVPVMFPVKG